MVSKTRRARFTITVAQPFRPPPQRGCRAGGPGAAPAAVGRPEGLRYQRPPVILERTLGASAALAAFAFFIPAGAGAATCEGLASLSLPQTTITMAQVVAPGAFTPPAPPRGGSRGPTQNPFASLPSFCRVAATLAPTSDSDIKIEVWLPTSGWNSKFQAVGNGGWAGSISYPAMAEALRRGYATASTDTGHSTPGGAFALGHPEKFIDFAYRSEHEMTVKAKAIVAGFYGGAPRYSYWNGCSTGGRQGLAEAQRFPDDYDGIIAGASANPRTYLNSWQISIAQAMLKDPARFIPPAKYPVIHQAVLAACDAIDGVKDGLIDDPTKCRFDPKALECKGEPDGSCLTPPQVEAARIVMSPIRDPKTGVEIFPGLESGTELGWAGLVGGFEPNATALDQFKYVVFKDPNWDWRTFDLTRDLARANQVDNGTINAINPDLGKFAGHGGKLLMYHGWSDPLVAPRASVNYYMSVVKKMGGPEQTSNWVRLFMAPGMGHCGGGEGPNTFDMLTALEQWVEKGQAPAQIIASHSTSGAVDRTRPLCPYPQVATYAGSGSIDQAANFACR
jgi:feruloyl esterase